MRQSDLPSCIVAVRIRQQVELERLRTVANLEQRTLHARKDRAAEPCSSAGWAY